MRKIIVLGLLTLARASGAGCADYYQAQKAIHATWALNPRVAKVKLQATEGKAIENLQVVDISIPLDAGQRPGDVAHPGEIAARPIAAATPLGLGVVVMDGIKSVTGNRSTNTSYNNSLNNNRGGNVAASSDGFHGATVTSQATAEGATSTGGNPGVTSNSSENRGDADYGFSF